MKLSEWAKRQGITYRTAWSWFNNKQIPNAYQTPTGTILVDEQNTFRKEEKIVVYCRVSSNSRRHEIQYQVDRCVVFCNARGLSVSKIFKEVASGMNDKRRELLNML